MDPTLLSGLTSFAVCLAIILTERWHHQASHDFSGDRRKVHDDAVPRIGGLGVLAGVFVSTLANRDLMAGSMMAILLCSIPAFLAGFQEDLTKSVGPSLRLMATLLSGALAWAFLDVRVSSVAIPVFDWFLAMPLISFLFTTLAIAGMSHGFNLVDGFHGLCGMTALAMFGALAYMAQGSGDQFVMALCLIGFSATLGFIALNWPSGRLFLGDGGAYFLGYWVACSGILLHARNPEISPFAILLVSLFPTMEVAFSALRRVGCAGRSVTEADRGHLHHLIYHRLSRRWFGAHRLMAQSSVVLFYAPVWLVFVWIPLLYPDSHLLNALACLGFVSAYVWLYQRLSRFAYTVREARRARSTHRESTEQHS